MWAFSLGKGFCLGFLAYFLGFLMDTTVSCKSFLELMEKTPKLMIDAYQKIQINLLVISPFIYMVNDQFLINHESNLINCRHAGALLLIHHIGYYIVHKSMHQINYLRGYHDFHHKFDKHLCPSIGNAVSHTEFLFAYVLPFVMGGYIIKPNEITFIVPIGLISIFNNLIHCKELKNVPWLPLFVSPAMHIKHHEVRDKHYSAPILDLDYFLEK